MSTRQPYAGALVRQHMLTHELRLGRRSIRAEPRHDCVSEIALEVLGPHDLPAERSVERSRFVAALDAALP